MATSKTPIEKFNPNKWVVLRILGTDLYYCWLESSYDKLPLHGFLSKLEAEFHCQNMNRNIK
jgi:hypothetical protein